MAEDNAITKCGIEKPIAIIEEDGDPITTVTLKLPSGEIKIKESDSYARKLANILNSPKIKEEIGEQMIASYEQTTGIIFKKTTSWYVTNHRVFCLNEEENILIQIPLKYVDVVVRNVHSFSKRTGAIVGGIMPGFMHAGMGFTQGQSIIRRIGDVNFLLQGQIIIIIPNVLDPAGLKQLLYQIKKQLHNGD